MQAQHSSSSVRAEPVFSFSVVALLACEHAHSVRGDEFRSLVGRVSAASRLI